MPKNDDPVEGQAVKSLKRRPCRESNRQTPKNDGPVEGQAVKMRKVTILLRTMAVKSIKMTSLSGIWPPRAEK
jgi:hypothetical protein